MILFSKPPNTRQFRNTDYYLSQSGELFKHYRAYRKMPERFKRLRPVLSAGYFKINLPSNLSQKRSSIGVHVMIVETFYGPKPKEGMVVNHINGIKTDNRVINLEWVTRSGNQIHAYDTGLHRHFPQKLTEKQVIAIRRSKLGRVRLGRKYGVNENTIAKIKKREIWKHV